MQLSVLYVTRPIYAQLLKCDAFASSKYDPSDRAALGDLRVAPDLVFPVRLVHQ